jgi:hypothetical protein
MYSQLLCQSLKTLIVPAQPARQGRNSHSTAATLNTLSSHQVEITDLLELSCIVYQCSYHNIMYF